MRGDKVHEDPRDKNSHSSLAPRHLSADELYAICGEKMKMLSLTMIPSLSYMPKIMELLQSAGVRRLLPPTKVLY